MESDSKEEIQVKAIPEVMEEPVITATPALPIAA